MIVAVNTLGATVLAFGRCAGVERLIGRAAVLMQRDGLVDRLAALVDRELLNVGTVSGRDENAAFERTLWSGCRFTVSATGKRRGGKQNSE